MTRGFDACAIITPAQQLCRLTGVRRELTIRREHLQHFATTRQRIQGIGVDHHRAMLRTCEELR